MFRFKCSCGEGWIANVVEPMVAASFVPLIIHEMIEHWRKGHALTGPVGLVQAVRNAARNYAARTGQMPIGYRQAGEVSEQEARAREVREDTSKFWGAFHYPNKT